MPIFFRTDEVQSFKLKSKTMSAEDHDVVSILRTFGFNSTEMNGTFWSDEYWVYLSPLDVAIFTNDVQICNYVKEHFNKKELKEMLLGRIGDGGQPFALACGSGSLDVSKWLFEQSKEMLIVVDESSRKNTVIESFNLAALGNHVHVCEWLYRLDEAGDINEHHFNVLRRSSIEALLLTFEKELRMREIFFRIFLGGVCLTQPEWVHQQPSIPSNPRTTCVMKKFFEKEKKSTILTSGAGKEEKRMDVTPSPLWIFNGKHGLLQNIALFAGVPTKFNANRFCALLAYQYADSCIYE